VVREIAHLARDDGEAAALFARARRFDRRVECQDVGLEGDAVDDGNDVDDRSAANPCIFGRPLCR
jgi:hypothetical protein